MLKTLALSLLLALSCGALVAQQTGSESDKAKDEARAESSRTARASAEVRVKRTSDGETVIETSGEGDVEVERTADGVRVRARAGASEMDIELPDFDRIFEDLHERVRAMQRKAEKAFERARNGSPLPGASDRFRDIERRLERVMEELESDKNAEVEEYEHVSEDGTTRVRVRIVRRSSSSESDKETPSAPKRSETPDVQ
jgi:hypothetical protein